MFTTIDQRETLLQEYKSTNYSAPDLALIQKIYDVFYQQKVTGQARHRFRRRHEVIGSEAGPEGVELNVRDLETGHTDITRYDAVVLATGYFPARQLRAHPWLERYIAVDFGDADE